MLLALRILVFGSFMLLIRNPFSGIFWLWIKSQSYFIKLLNKLKEISHLITKAMFEAF